MRAVAVIPAAGLLAGAALGLLLPDVPVAPAMALLVFSAGVAGWALGRSEWPALAAAVAAGFCASGAMLAADAWHEAWRPSLRVAFERLAGVEHSVSAILTGTLRADATPGANGVLLRLDAISLSHPLETANVQGGVQLTVAGSLAAAGLRDWRAGRVLRMPAELRRPSRYLNPGVPDQERALARRGTTLVGSVKSGVLVEVVARGSAVSEAAAAARAFVRRAVASAVGRWSRQSAAIVTAIVIGDRAGLDEEVRLKLQKAGTYHVIAISGGNIAILAGLTLALFRVAGVLGRGAMLVAIAGLTAYGYLVDGGASVERATLMAILYLCGRAIDLRGPPLNALALVAAALVAVDPLAITDSAFLLTFGATAGILVVVPLVPVRKYSKVTALAATLFTASLAAEAVLLPVGALLFSRVTFAGLVLNFAAIPLMAVAQIAGMAAVSLALVSPSAATGAGWVAAFAAEGLVRSADLVDLAPVLTWRVAAPHWTAMAAYYVGLTVAWVLWRRRVVVGSAERPASRAALRAAVAVGAAAGLWILAQPWAALRSIGDGKLHVTFIDVGQGDAIFVRFPRGGTLLVDAGGLAGVSTFDMGDRVVAPVLRHTGARRLESVALTHGDRDHIGGGLSIVREFRPRDVWEGIPVPPFAPLQAVRAAAEAVRARWANVQTGDVVSIDGVLVAVRHPQLPDWERQDVRNDDSLVLELLWRDVSIVLTGDIGQEVERTIAPLFPDVPLRIVKVPHHGSLTSSTPEFVAALQPRIAVVSAGRGNPFGHPVPAVLERYAQAGAEIFRTDQDGAVMAQTDGRSVEIRTFTGRTYSVASGEPRKHESTK